MSDIRQIFKNGAEGYTPATMWFTSGNISKNELTYQIENFDRQGIRDYFIHPSDHTQGDYMGDHFFRMIRHAADEAKRLGNHYWIYDEYNWSSGVVGGQVLLKYPWTRASRLFKLTETVQAGQTLFYPLPDKARFNPEVLLCTVDGEAVETSIENETLVWKNPADTEKTLEIYMVRWTVGKCAATKGSEVIDPAAEGYLDTMDREAVAKFIEMTHEVYKKEIGEGFGDYVKGVFTDETVLLFDLREADEVGLPVYPWTRQFLQKFRERNGYDIRPRLHELMANTDPGLNIDYWETIGGLFIDAFPRMCGEWCEQNNLIFTGHIDAEESIEAAVNRSGDPYEYYKHFGWPGIDTIYTFYRIGDYSYNIAPKLASSAAHFHNKERVLSETYTISGWEIRLRDMKRIFNRLALLGINCLQFMGSRYDFSLTTDSSAMTNNWQNPLFKHYNGFSKYVSGLQWLVANSALQAHTLLFYPLTTIRGTMPPMPTDVYRHKIDFTISGLINAMLNLHVDFEIGYEQVIDQAELKDGKLWFAGSFYETVILPGATILREETYRKLQAFAQAGGRVIAVNGAPEKIVGDTLYDAPAIPGAIVYDCEEFEKVGPYVNYVETYQRTPMGTFTQRLKEALAGVPEYIVHLEPSDGVFSAVRKMDDNYYVIIINDNKTDAGVQGKLLCDRSVCALNTENGEVREMSVDGKAFALTLAPYECVVLEIADGQFPVCVPEAAAGREISLQSPSFSIEEPNTALPDMWQVRGEAAQKIVDAWRVRNPKRVCDVAASLASEDMVACRASTLPSIPNKAKRDWYGWTPVDKQPVKPGETVVCVFDFTVETVPADLCFVTDPGREIAWYLNEEQLYQTSSQRVWHYANPVFDIHDIAVPGKNRLIAICTMPSYQGGFTLPCAVLKGDFRVFEDKVLTQKPGTNELTYWNDQGYTFHTGDGIYKASFEAPADSRVILELATTDVAEVFVNGVCAGKRLWDPYKLDLTAYVQLGINQLEVRVTSTLSNLIYNRSLSGIAGMTVTFEQN
ncbi:MAG: hypothetical protein E7463_03325 [Ruminococcaceae bacterium]|nr:hypothetical protein [Oscillospiraceae bacterium]